MAVTRRVHVVKPRSEWKLQKDAGDGLQYAQIYTDPAVTALMDTFAPAERIVGIAVVPGEHVPMIYIFTESFGLGPVTKS